jgi:DNA repair protein RadC
LAAIVTADVQAGDGMARRVKQARIAEQRVAKTSAPNAGAPERGIPQPGIPQPGIPQPGISEPGMLFDLMEAQEPGSTALGAEGHRARMRTRLLTAGPDALADHEMLEMVLFLALPRRDTKPIARALLDQFGGFGAVISAPLAELARIEGLGEAGGAALKLVQAASLRLLKRTVVEKPVLDRWDVVTDYLVAALGHERVEQFRVLFLDNRNRLLADEILGRGTVNHAPVYPREIVRRSLELHATGVILCHNHPSGDPTPSRDDIAMTAEIRRAVEVLRIVVHDHLIVAGQQCVSFRREGLL